ncbi:MAG TPA: hypothetical protein VFA10_09680 [Ktedonobacteraceae bacterium]|nr:hypothetical protein [Ktedonobacteraceae bacterium]
MTVLLQKLGNPQKNTTDSLFFGCLTNQHTAFGQVIGNGLVLALAGEEGRWD